MSYFQFKRDLKKKQKLALKDKQEREVILSLQRMSDQYSARKQEYLEKAKKSYQAGDTAAYHSAVSLLKNIMFQKAQVEDMLTNYLMVRDICQMDRVRASFTKTLHKALITDEKMMGKIKIQKTEEAFSRVMGKQSGIAEEFKSMLSDNNMQFSTYADSVSNVTEGDIRYMIETNIGGEKHAMDSRFAALEKELFGNMEVSEKESPISDGMAKQ